MTNSTTTGIPPAHAVRDFVDTHGLDAVRASGVLCMPDPVREAIAVEVAERKFPVRVTAGKFEGRSGVVSFVEWSPAVEVPGGYLPEAVYVRVSFPDGTTTLRTPAVAVALITD